MDLAVSLRPGGQYKDNERAVQAGTMHRDSEEHKGYSKGNSQMSVHRIFINLSTLDPSQTSVEAFYGKMLPPSIRCKGRDFVPDDASVYKFVYKVMRSMRDNITEEALITEFDKIICLPKYIQRIQ